MFYAALFWLDYGTSEMIIEVNKGLENVFIKVGT